MASRARYDVMVNQIKADLKISRGREVSDTRIDQMLTVAVGWFMDLNPDRWPWAMVQAESAASNESLSIQTDAGALGATFTVEPALSGFIGVRTQVGATTGDWKDLIHHPWAAAIRAPWYNREDTATVNQVYWSIKVTGTVTADKFPTYTLETFPKSYPETAGDGSDSLYYQADYRRKTPVVSAGASADDALVWDDQSWDYCPMYVAEALVAHELNRPTTVAEAWGFAREFARNILRGSGVEETRIKVPPPFILREAQVV